MHLKQNSYVVSFRTKEDQGNHHVTQGLVKQPFYDATMGTNLFLASALIFLSMPLLWEGT